MSQNTQHKMFAVPGVKLQDVGLFEAGNGAYEINGKIVASIMGKVVIDDPIDGIQKVNVISYKSNSECGIAVGDRVICKVLRIMTNQVNVEIICVGDKDLRQSAPAIIRKEDTRLTDTDKVIMHECFRPGDLVKAAVISLGDQRQYFLSTADVEFGVTIARHESTGRIMTPCSWKVPLFHLKSSAFEFHVIYS